MATRCDQALNYARQGFPVFPIQPGLKIPFPGSRGLHDATVDPDQVRAWWEKYPEANIGLRTGEVSGVTVVDFDQKSGGMDSFASWPQPILTFQVETPGGGRHLYYKYEPTLRQTTGLRPGVDVRNDGGYVLAPGSVVGGREYRVVVKTQFAELPAGVLKSLTSGSSAAGSSAAGSKATEPSAARGGSGELGAITEGGRNAGLTKIAGALRKQGLSEEGMRSALLAINETECDPPLSEKEVETIAWSVARYEPEPDEVPSSTLIRIQDTIEPSYDYLTDKNLVKGEPTGFDKLDELLGGGMRRGELVVLHAQAKTGKNVLLHKILLNWAQRGIPVGYASREVRPTEEVVPDLISKALGKNAWKDPITLEEMKAAAADWPVFFSSGQGYFPIEELKAWVKNLKENHGVNYFLMDHLHYMLPKEEWQLASELIRVQKALVNKLNICIFEIIQPTQPKEGLDLGLGTLKGGSAIGQAIDTLICMNHIYYNDASGKRQREQNVRLIEVKEVRHKLAKRGQLYLQYDPETTDLVEGDYTPAAPSPLSRGSYSGARGDSWDSEAMQVE